MSRAQLVAEAEQHIKEQAARAFRCGELFQEEGHGLLYRLNHHQPLQWSTDPEKQAQFLKGFNDACEILRVAEGVEAAS